MTSRPNWLVWKYLDGKKIPWDHALQAVLRWSNTELWLPYEEACTLRDAHGYDGIGYITTEDDGLILIDIDNAFDADGNVKPWAQAWVDLATAMELSVSGTGVHLYGLWSGPPLHTNTEVHTDGIMDGRIELYTYGKFFAMTERWVDGRTEVKTLDVDT